MDKLGNLDMLAKGHCFEGRFNQHPVDVIEGCIGPLVGGDLWVTLLGFVNEVKSVSRSGRSSGEVQFVAFGDKSVVVEKAHFGAGHSLGSGQLRGGIGSG